MTDAAALGLLERAVRTSSVTGEERAVAEVLVEAAAAAADEAFIDAAGNAVARWGAGARKVTFLGHMDTVPGHVTVRLEEGVLHGRGAVDAKGSLCMAIAAMARLPASLKDRLSLLVVGAVEEEGPSSKGARFAAATYPTPDLVIIGEPSGWEAYTLGYKGRLLLRLVAERDNAHSSRDEPTAAAVAVEGWQQVLRFVAQDAAHVDAGAVDAGRTVASDGIRGRGGGASSLFDALQVSLQDITSTNDGLTQRCEATIGFRLPPRWPPDELARALLELPFPDGVRARTAGGETAYRADNRSELARAFRVAIRAGGGRPRPKLKTGTSDMNVVAKRWSVPMLAYGPGDASLDHTPDERIEVAEYLRSVEVLRHALELLALEG